MKPSTSFHPRNFHRGRYDLERLSAVHPPLLEHLTKTPVGELTVDFADPAAVQVLNAALLRSFYQIEVWQVPPGYLCPPIPGRADYLHHVADLLAESGELPTGKGGRLLDVGCGASLIYPILASRLFGWRCVGSDVDAGALRAAQLLVDANPVLQGQIRLRRQVDAGQIFRGVVRAGEFFQLTVCNPPFYGSAEEAAAVNLRKRRNLGIKEEKVARNFAGKDGELWCAGGEMAFVGRMMRESVAVAEQVGWFTSLIASKEHVKPLRALALDLEVSDLRVIQMQHGQKGSRVLAWRF